MLAFKFVQAQRREPCISQHCWGVGELFSLIMNDREAQEALGALISKATAKRLDHVDPSHMSSIKTLCRASDRNVEAAFDLLYQRLKHTHSQARPPHPWMPAACKTGYQSESALCML